MRQLRVLVTGAGAPGVRGTLHALHHNPDGIEISTVGVDLQADPVGRHMVDRFFQVPAPESDAYLDVLADIGRREAIDVIVPQTTREVAVLARRRGDLPVPVMVGDAEAVERANDKFRLLEAFAEIGLPHPEYALVTSPAELVRAAERFGYPVRPVVVKPPVSNGMRGLRILREHAWNVERYLREKPTGIEISLPALCEILERGTAWPALLVTEYLPGAEYSVDAFVGTSTEVAIPRLRCAIRDGISFRTALDWREDLIRPTLDGARYIGLRLVFGFQYKLDAHGVPKVLECNPRVQGTMVASLFSGTNVVWLGIRELLGWPGTPATRPVSPGAAFYRFWGGLAVQADGTTIEI
ncbi:MAG: ATP-grasp domain-containing protein [Acidobacteria bacterium]|nr:ATP-grasp domain-containing protein [Acidobacteriota bacterium]